MATLREYFEKDFDHVFKMSTTLSFQQTNLEFLALFDFTAACVYISSYIPAGNYDVNYFKKLIQLISKGGTFNFDNKVILPSAKSFLGTVQIKNDHPFEIQAKFMGEPDWRSSLQLRASTRIFLYSETDLPTNDIQKLYKFSFSVNVDCQFRSIRYRDERSNIEHPLAFISHDSRDKEKVAFKIARGLQSIQCPVWYDQYSLKVGDHLRDSIEKGLKECKKCILILRKHFFNNKGWTKVEFDSIFSRQILQKTNLILPIWVDVTENEVYEYSPSLSIIKGIIWSDAKVDNICHELSRAIDD